MTNDSYKKIFEPDSGTLLQIVVFGATHEDWRRFLDYLSSHYLLAYSEDGVQRELPDITSIIQELTKKSLMLEIMLPGFTINCHFLSIQDIEMNVRPEDVDSSQKADAIFDLMKGMSVLLNKEVYLAPEFGSALPEEVRLRSLCTADPVSRSIRCSCD